jgi:hypothetical protein
MASHVEQSANLLGQCDLQYSEHEFESRSALIGKVSALNSDLREAKPLAPGTPMYRFDWGAGGGGVHATQVFTAVILASFAKSRKEKTKGVKSGDSGTVGIYRDQSIS